MVFLVVKPSLEGSKTFLRNEYDSQKSKNSILQIIVCRRLCKTCFSGKLTDGRLCSKNIIRTTIPRKLHGIGKFRIKNITSITISPDTNDSGTRVGTCQTSCHDNRECIYRIISRAVFWCGGVQQTDHSMVYLEDSRAYQKRLVSIKKKKKCVINNVFEFQN